MTDAGDAATVLSGSFATAAAGITELAALDLDALSPAELNEAVVAFQHLRARLDAAEARALARWDAERSWRLDGAKSGPAWLAWRSRLPIEEARRRMRHARALRTLPEVAQAWSAGQIDRAHITTLLGARNPRTADAFASEHHELLDAARTQGFIAFKRICDMWVNVVDQDGAEQRAGDDLAAREVHLSKSIGGMWFGRMTLDPVNGTIVHETLAMIERELFEADWREARDRLERDPLVMELCRTPAQRRTDALVEMAVRARTAPADGRRPAPLFTVVVGYETFAGPVLELFDRTVITPGTAAGWLSEAYVERVVFDGPSRVIDVGAQRRFFRGALRRAIEVRDRTCFHPTCDEVPRRPHVDHIHEASKGGETTQRNGRSAATSTTSTATPNPVGATTVRPRSPPSARSTPGPTHPTGERRPANDRRQHDGAARGLTRQVARRRLMRPRSPERAGPDSILTRSALVSSSVHRGAVAESG